MEVDSIRAKELFEKAIENGSISALVNLGDMLTHGYGEVVADPVRSKQLYEIAVENGNAKAMNKLADLLEFGTEGMDRDHLTRTDVMR